MRTQSPRKLEPPTSDWSHRERWPCFRCRHLLRVRWRSGLLPHRTKFQEEKTVNAFWPLWGRKDSSSTQTRARAPNYMSIHALAPDFNHCGYYANASERTRVNVSQPTFLAFRRPLSGRYINDNTGMNVGQRGNLVLPKGCCGTWGGFIRLLFPKPAIYSEGVSDSRQHRRLMNVLQHPKTSPSV